MSECVLWSGRIDRNGYGRHGAAFAHRYVYERDAGPIPPGLDLDHLCRVRSCVNPEHLEPVTRAENLRRGISANREKTACKNGHPYDQANTYRKPGGGRDCRACNSEAVRRYRARKAVS